MDTFAFIIHPIDPKRDVSRKYPLLGKLFNEKQIDLLCALFPPVFISEINGVRSIATSKQIKGWFIACPLTPARMLSLPERSAYHKIIQSGRVAEKLGAMILGLGAFTSIVGDGGITIARELDIPVTTGDAYTVSIAVEAVRSAAQAVGIPIQQATAAVVGASGSIGRICAELLAGEVAELYLVGRRLDRLQELQRAIQASAYPHECTARLHTGTDLKVLQKAHLVITVTSALHTIVKPEHLRPGSVVCDVARPRDVSASVAASRQDVLVIDGGMVEVPGNVNFNFDFGYPPGKAYACMAETMALALEGRFEDYTLGKSFDRRHVEEIAEIAARHGFRLSGFRSFERQVTEAQIDQARRYAQEYL